MHNAAQEKGWDGLSLCTDGSLKFGHIKIIIKKPKRNEDENHIEQKQRSFFFLFFFFFK